MTTRPVEFKSVMHYPIAQQTCTGCVHDHTPKECQEFTAFVKKDTGFYRSCSGSGNDNNVDVIWQTGDTARLKYITERLTT